MARPARRAVWWVGSVDAAKDGTEGVTGGREGEGEGERERGRERARGRRQEGDELGQAWAEVVEVGGSISSRDQKQRRLQRKGKRANNSHSQAPRGSALWRVPGASGGRQPQARYRCFPGPLRSKCFPGRGACEWPEYHRPDAQVGHYLAV